ncbi:iron-hydroxamate transporter permease subunit [Salmonella enterica subsp. enterica]|uniref:Iron-hydroxamate transporter permease subunit n=1 Tax=Salmonella enterica I TaxID=59201 RepID=A0A447PLP8_SALET|nr:iron-hydroxamate transporter permease subunit [Salmonella enterica subsp. enterica]
MSRKREMPDGGAKNALSDLRFGRFVGRIRRSRHPALLLLALFVAACWLTSVNFLRCATAQPVATGYLVTGYRHH